MMAGLIKAPAWTGLVCTVIAAFEAAGLMLSLWALFDIRKTKFFGKKLALMLFVIASFWGCCYFLINPLNTGGTYPYELDRALRDGPFYFTLMGYSVTLLLIAVAVSKIKTHDRNNGILERLMALPLRRLLWMLLVVETVGLVMVLVTMRCTSFNAGGITVMGEVWQQKVFFTFFGASVVLLNVLFERFLAVVQRSMRVVKAGRPDPAYANLKLLINSTLVISVGFVCIVGGGFVVDAVVLGPMRDPTFVAFELTLHLFQIFAVYLMVALHMRMKLLAKEKAEVNPISSLSSSPPTTIQVKGPR
jgi:hypothetical protein